MAEAMRYVLLNTVLKLCVLAVFLTVSAPAPSIAQNYGTLQGLNFGGSDDPAPPEPDAEEDVADPDELAAYGQVAEVYKEQSAISATQESVNIFRQKLRRFMSAAPDYLGNIGETLDGQSPTGSWTYFLGVFVFVAFLLAIGRAGATLGGVYIALPVMRRIQKPNPQGMVEKLPVLAARVGLQLGLMVLALAIVVAVGSGFYVDHEPTIKTVVAVIGAWVIGQVIDVCWRMSISPFLPLYRIPRMTDTEAVRLYRWVTVGAWFGVISITYYTWLEEMGASEETVGLSIMGSTLISVILAALLIRYNGRAITHAMLGGATRTEASWLGAVASVLWRPVVLAYFVFAMLEMSFRVIMGLERGVPLLAGFFGVLLSVLLVYALTVYIVERLFHRARAVREMNDGADAAEAAEAADRQAIRDALTEVGDGDGDGDEEGGGGRVQMAPPPRRSHQMRTFEDLARRIASLFALGAGLYLLISIWVGEGAFAEGTVFDIGQDLIDIALIGYIVFHAARIWMDRKIEEEAGPEVEAELGDEGGGASAASRLATILPLFRAFVLIVIAASAVLLILMELGVNVAPLFAGAGVVGLAIGFGAQSLVRDILSGVFFLTDDAFRKGEYIDIGDVKGTVEKISLRSFQLRHHLGALNTVPFGEIKFLTNYSRDWVMMKLPLRLTYDTDVDKVRKLVKKLGVKLLDHPTEGHKFVQPLKSQGVYMMEDSAMIIRVKFMTRPGDQWTTRKLVYQEIRNLFEQEGIRFAHKEVTVRIPEIEGKRPEQLSEEERKAVGAAARRAVEEEGPAPAMADER